MVENNKTEQMVNSDPGDKYGNEEDDSGLQHRTPVAARGRQRLISGVFILIGVFLLYKFVFIGGGNEDVTQSLDEESKVPKVKVEKLIKNAKDVTPVNDDHKITLERNSDRVLPSAPKITIPTPPPVAYPSAPRIAPQINIPSFSESLPRPVESPGGALSLGPPPTLAPPAPRRSSPSRNRQGGGIIAYSGGSSRSGSGGSLSNVANDPGSVLSADGIRGVRDALKEPRSDN